MIVLGTLFAQSMENNNIAYSDKKQKEYKKHALRLEKYNQKVPLLCLFPEIRDYIISYCFVFHEDSTRSLELSMKTFMRLSCVSKYFYTFLNFERIGNLCKDYAQIHKDRALSQVARCISTYRYEAKSLYALILVYAGTDATFEHNRLLQKAVLEDDAQFVDILLKHNANPYRYMQKEGPIFFYAQTIEVAQVFIDYNINIHVGDHIYPNILWFILNDEYSADLMDFYLNHGVNARLLSDWEGNYCLLHGLARCSYVRDRDNFLKKGQFLLNAIPDMVNALSRSRKTPIDIVQCSLESSKEFYGEEHSIAYKELISLLKLYGGLTANELAKSKKKRNNCIIS